MKKHLLFLLLSFYAVKIYAQPVLLSENFDTYNGLVASIPAGFYISWNDTASASKSFYSSAGTCGLACNAYKFGMDSATIITPSFSNAGSVSFYFKGNGTPNAQNIFYVYESSNGTTWNQITAIQNFSTSAQNINLPVNSSSTQLKFYYSKPALGINVGFDDLIIYGPTGINQPQAIEQVNLYPTPASGSVTVDFGSLNLAEVSLSISNVLGKEVKRIDFSNASGKRVLNLTDLAEGVYLVRVKSGPLDAVKRIIIRK